MAERRDDIRTPPSQPFVWTRDILPRQVVNRAERDDTDREPSRKSAPIVKHVFSPARSARYIHHHSPLDRFVSLR